MPFVKRLKKSQQQHMLSLLVCIFLIVAALIVFSLEVTNKQTNHSNLQATLSQGTSATLFVNKLGDGQGNVSSKPIGINCGDHGAHCIEYYKSGTSVTLTATSDSGSIFGRWYGDCPTTSTNKCLLIMDGDKSATAYFDKKIPTQKPKLTVVKAGTGTGTVTGTGINCGSDCTESYTSGTSVTLTAAPLSGSTFASWSGACTGTGTCTVNMTSDKSVTATFGPVSTSTTATWYPCDTNTCTSSSSCGYIKGSITKTCPTGKIAQTGKCIPMPNNHVGQSYKSGNGWYCKFHCNSSICWTSDGCALVQCK